MSTYFIVSGQSSRTQRKPRLGLKLGIEVFQAIWVKWLKDVE